jgi:peroxiredoxin
LISDPENALSSKVGAVRDQHWAGPMVHPTTYLVDAGGIVRWRFQSQMAQRPPSPILLANMAGAVVKQQPLPEYVED